MLYVDKHHHLKQKPALTFGLIDYGAAYLTEAESEVDRLLSKWTPDVPKDCNPFNQRCRVKMILRLVSDGGGSRSKL